MSAAQPSEGEFAEYVAFDEFRSGLAAGRLRVIVNPKLARRYVSQRLLLMVLVVPVIGVGLALALVGATWPGALLVFGGVALNRVVSWQAPKILLYLASRDAGVYEQATHGGVMEVRRV
jgi:hypothetical protein